MDSLKVGEVWKHYCMSYFGSRAYGDKELVAWGWNWLLVRIKDSYDGSYLSVAEFDSQEQMMKYVEEWRKGEDDG